MDNNSDNVETSNQTNNKKESTSKCSKYKKKKNSNKKMNTCSESNNGECKINTSSDASNTNNIKLDLKLYQFSYADYVLLSSTIAYAIGEDLNDADLDILIAFFGMITSDLAILRTRRGIIDGLSKAQSINNGEEDIIGAIESSQASESVASNLSREAYKHKNKIKKVKKKRNIKPKKKRNS